MAVTRRSSARGPDVADSGIAERLPPDMPGALPRDSQVLDRLRADAGLDDVGVKSVDLQDTLVADDQSLRRRRT